jgi:hypothetical protein
VYAEFSDPIIGSGSIDGSDIVYESSVIKPYGPNIIYETIPYEMLRSYHRKP